MIRISDFGLYDPVPKKTPSQRGAMTRPTRKAMRAMVFAVFTCLGNANHEGIVAQLVHLYIEGCGGPVAGLV